MPKHSPFRYFKTSPEIIRLAVMLYVRFPLSLRNVEDLLHERGIEISHETVRFWWNRFGPMFAAEIRRNRVSRMRSYSNWQWHLDEVFLKINGETHYLWLTEQSPRAFGHINTQAYGKTKVQSKEELSEVRLPMLKWMRLRVPWRQKLEA